MTTSLSYTERQPLGLPAGSVRSILLLLVVGMICAMVLISTVDDPIAIPPYLVYLLFLMIGSFFASHGVTIGRRELGERGPLFLPRGVVRFLLLAILVGTIVWKVVNDLPGWEKQFEKSVDAISLQPLLPLYVLGGYLGGTVLKFLTRPFQKSAAYQDIMAWLALLSMLLMAADLLIELVINPSLQPEQRLNMPHWQGFLAAIVALYYGLRS